MGKKRVVEYYNGRLKGSYLTEKKCDGLEKLLTLIDTPDGVVTDLKHVIYDLQPHEVELIMASKSSDMVPEKSIGTLENLQTVAVAYMYIAERLVLGDSVGLGKTVEVCGLLNLLEQNLLKEGREFRFLYVTEKNLVRQAQKELIKFTGNYVEAVYGEKKHVQKFCQENSDELMYSIVCPHSIFGSVDFQEFLLDYERYYFGNPFDIIIIDESGVLGNTKSQMYQNARFFLDRFDRAIELNATAFESNLTSFFNQLSIIDDSFLPTKGEFDKTYVEMTMARGYPQPSGKYKNEGDFRKKVAYRYLARTRKSSGATMTGCTAEVVVSDLSKEQKSLMTRVGLPYMVYDCPSYFPEGVPMNVDTTPKLKDLIYLIDTKLKKEPSILVYSRYKESQEGIRKALYENGIYSEIMNGDTKQKDRDDKIDRFKVGSLRVLITNVQKGLNFGNCNVCIFYSYDSSPNGMVQFEGRMTRSFNIVGKSVFLLVSRGKELKKFKSDVADKAVASDLFAGSDFSCVLSILLDSGVLDSIK